MRYILRAEINFCGTGMEHLPHLRLPYDTRFRKCSENFIYFTRLNSWVPSLGKNKIVAKVKVSAAVACATRNRIKERSAKMNMKWPFRHGFWETVAVLLLSLADVSSHQGHLLSHTPSHSVRPHTQLEVIFSGWHGPSFKQTVKRHLNGGNESSWELSGGWYTSIMACLTERFFALMAALAHHPSPGCSDGPATAHWLHTLPIQLMMAPTPPTKHISNFSGLQLSTTTYFSPPPFIPLCGGQLTSWLLTNPSINKDFSLPLRPYTEICKDLWPWQRKKKKN